MEYSSGIQTGGQRGRRRENTGGVGVLTRPTPSCQNSSFTEWGTLRIFRDENEVGRLFQQPTRVRGWRLAEW